MVFESQRSTAVVILAAGQGTRMKSRRAKVLHELCGRPMLAYEMPAERSFDIDYQYQFDIAEYMMQSTLKECD